MKAYKISAYKSPMGPVEIFGNMKPHFYVSAESIIEAVTKFKAINGDKYQDPHHIEELGEFVS